MINNFAPHILKLFLCKIAIINVLFINLQVGFSFDFFYVLLDYAINNCLPGPLSEAVESYVVLYKPLKGKLVVVPNFSACFWLLILLFAV